MYYDEQRKLAFVLPTRTGTTTFSMLLRDWGATKVEGIHPKPDEAQIENFNEYKIYGFFRNPLDRFLSLLRYIREGKIIAKNFYANCGITGFEFSAFTYDQMLDAFPKYQPLVPKFFDPQVAWLANATALDFNNYTAEILRVARMFDVKQVNLAVNNWTDSGAEVPSQQVIDYVQSTYADDYRLGRERGLLA
jgi:hypothetical protein